MTHLSFIKHYEGILSNAACDWLISSLEEDDRLVLRRNGPQNFDELNLNQTHPEVINAFVQPLLGALELYRKDFPLETSYFPDLALEEFRVKRYTGGTGQQFADHVDVGSLSSCKRYLAFLFYLNDNFTGGETHFFPDTIIKPKKGSVVVFPPTWMYPHAGLPVETGNKYIMSSYLNYSA